MNRLLTPLSNAIIEHSGTIDKYMGDAIMAFWNAPLDIDDHAAHACRAALDMRARLDRLNHTLRAEAEVSGRLFSPLSIGIGINTGACTVGNMGSDIRFDYSVLGDAVNLAARLEGQTKSYGVPILLGEATARHVENRFALLELDRIRVVGKTESNRIFALAGDADTRQQASFTTLQSEMAVLLDRYRERRWSEAAALASHLAQQSYADDYRGYFAILLQRIAVFRTTPPPVGWDGAHQAESK